MSHPHPIIEFSQLAPRDNGEPDIVGTSAVHCWRALRGAKDSLLVRGESATIRLGLTPSIRVVNVHGKMPSGIMKGGRPEGLAPTHCRARARPWLSH